MICPSYSMYAKPMKKIPSVPLMAYNRAISNEGAFEALLEDDDESLDPDGPLKTWVGFADVELAVCEVAVAVALVSLAVLGLLAPHGWSCLQALAQLLSKPQAFSH